MPTPTFPERPANEPRITPAEAIDAIGRGAYSSKELQALSDLSRMDAKALAETWPAYPEDQRIALLRALADASEEHVYYLYGRVFRIGLTDSSAVVRQLSVAGLWEDETDGLVDEFIAIMQNDPSDDVRAEAAVGLSRFAQLAEMEELDEEIAERMQAALLDAITSDDQSQLVRRRALESASILGGEAVRPLIAEAYDSDDTVVRASAIFAMGRAFDRHWYPTVISELSSDDAELRFEAVRASGDLILTDALPALAGLLDERDTDVRQATIIALGRIGGSGGKRILNNYAAHAPEADRELIDDALDEANLGDIITRELG